MKNKKIILIVVLVALMLISIIILNLLKPIKYSNNTIGGWHIILQKMKN